jgi:hypothetical protein
LSEKDKWERPAAPPPPLFLGEKERDLVKQINDENPLYGEAVVKNFLSPIRVYALIEWDGLKTTTSHYGLDKTNEITVHFHKRRLTEDQDLFAREGDFVAYGDFYYEIVSLSETKQLFGQIDHKFEISAKCIRSREGLFDAS